MRKLILMTSAAVIAPISAIAQTTTCTATPDCASLGYTEASCPNGGVKCPWGDKWFCATSESEVCSKYGFKYICTGTGYASGVGESCEGKYTSCTCSSPYTWSGGACSCPSTYKYTCSGTGYAGGSGTSCGGKYTSCSCSSEYVWSDGNCIAQPQWGTCTGLAKLCSIGDILFSDGTCSAINISGKTPIAIVVYKSSDGNCGQAMVVNDYIKYLYEWGQEIDIQDLPNYSSLALASNDFASCENTKKILAAGDSDAYPFAWVVYEYKTDGTEVGDWCVPAAGLYTSIINNLDSLKSVFYSIEGRDTYFYHWGWTSTEYDAQNAWALTDTKLDKYTKSTHHMVFSVRPVLEF